MFIKKLSPFSRGDGNEIADIRYVFYAEPQSLFQPYLALT